MLYKDKTGQGMREILFRGKRVDNGEWTEGSLLQVSVAGKTYILIFGDRFSFDGINMQAIEHGLVDPNTIGQYTGINDKNGKQIFEGDIVKFTRIDALGWTRKRIGQVLYYTELPIFYIKATTGDSWDWCVCEDLEIIGNTHDNPELLKENKP